MPDQTPAQTLTAAATRLREAVTDIAHVPVPWTQPPYPAKQGVLVAPSEETPILMAFWGGMSEYVALLNPGVGLAVADWLELTADVLNSRTIADPTDEYTVDVNDEHALTVARAILGSPS